LTVTIYIIPVYQHYFVLVANLGIYFNFFNNPFLLVLGGSSAPDSPRKCATVYNWRNQCKFGIIIIDIYTPIKYIQKKNSERVPSRQLCAIILNVYSNEKIRNVWLRDADDESVQAIRACRSTSPRFWISSVFRRTGFAPRVTATEWLSSSSLTDTSTGSSQTVEIAEIHEKTDADVLWHYVVIFFYIFSVDRNTALPFLAAGMSVWRWYVG